MNFYVESVKNALKNNIIMSFTVLRSVIPRSMKEAVISSNFNKKVLKLLNSLRIF